MKPFRRTYNPIMVLWLCLIVLFECKSIPNLVLCVGQNGHIELEAAVNDRCGKEEQETARPDYPALVAEDDGHCGECSDIPLISASRQSSPKNAIALSRDAATDNPDFFPVLPAVPFLPRETERPRILPPHLPPAILVSVLTVRLLV